MKQKNIDIFSVRRNVLLRYIAESEEMLSNDDIIEIVFFY